MSNVGCEPSVIEGLGTLEKDMEMGLPCIQEVDEPLEEWLYGAINVEEAILCTWDGSV